MMKIKKSLRSITFVTIILILMASLIIPAMAGKNIGIFSDTSEIQDKKITPTVVTSSFCLGSVYGKCKGNRAYEWSLKPGPVDTIVVPSTGEQIDFYVNYTLLAPCQFDWVKGGATLYRNDKLVDEKYTETKTSASNQWNFNDITCYPNDVIKVVLHIHITDIGLDERTDPSYTYPVILMPCHFILSSYSHAFTAWVGGTDSCPFSITNVGNSGTGNIQITGGTDPIYFSSVPTGSISLLAGQTQQIIVTFRPLKEGTFTAILQINGDNPGNSVSVYLSGKGKNDFHISLPESGNIVIGETQIPSDLLKSLNMALVLSKILIVQVTTANPDINKIIFKIDGQSQDASLPDFKCSFNNLNNNKFEITSLSAQGYDKDGIPILGASGSVTIVWYKVI